MERTRPFGSFIQCFLFVLREKVVEGNSGRLYSLNENKVKGFVLLSSTVIENDSELRQLFVRNNVEILDSLNCLLLHKSVEYNHLEVVELIVDRTAKKNVLASNCTPFFPVSVEAGSEDVTRSLLGKVAAVYKRNYEPYHIIKAIDDNNSKFVERLLTVTANISYRNPFGETLVHLAARRNDEVLVKLLVQQVSILNAERKDGSTPLHIAVQEGNLSFTSLLLKKGAAVNARKEDGSTSLFLAVRFQYLKIVKLLARNGADVNIGKHNGLTPLHLAAQYGLAEIVADFLELGALVNVSLTNSHANGVTPLCLAVEQQHSEVVSCLLEGGADVNMLCYDDQTILKLAADRESVSIVESILKYHPDLDNKISKKALCDSMVRFGEDFEEKAQMLMQHGFTVDAEYGRLTELLHNAICKGCIDVVKTLLKSGVNMNRVYHYFDDLSEVCMKSMPLLTAIENGRSDIVKLLINSGADVNVTFNLDDDLTPVNKFSYNQESAKILLASNASYRIEDNVDCGREGIIYSAIRYNNPDILENILLKGVKVDGNSCQSRTPITYAAKEGSLEMMKTLIKFGASVHSRDKDGLTALHLVTDRDCQEKVKFLVKNNADVEARCFIGQTPIFRAVKNGYAGVVRELLKYGVRVDIVDSFVRSPLHYAVAEGRCKMLETLLDYAFTDADFVRRINIFQLLRISYVENRSNDANDAYFFNQLKKHRQELTESAETLMFHLLKVKSAFTSKKASTLLFEKYLELMENGKLITTSLYFLDSCWTLDEADFETEIVSMKTQNVGATSISFFDILSKGVHQLTHYVRNSDIVKCLNSKEYEKQFPFFKNILFHQILKGTFRRKLLDESAEICHLLVCEFKLLSLDLKENVLSYLSNTDLEVVVYACMCISHG